MRLGAFAVIIGLAMLVPTVLLLHPGVARSSYRKSACMTNLKEIGLGFSMYLTDYHFVLPSSAVCGSSDYTYRKTLGQIPPPVRGNYQKKTIAQLICSYKKNRDLFFCPADPTLDVGWSFWKHIRKPQASDRTSYTLKKAVDQAWKDPKIKARREKDYLYPSEQVLFYEHTSFHWDRMPIVPKGKDGASFNVLYIDGHVKTVRLADSGIEPEYYNYDPSSRIRTGKRQIDPRRYGDWLP